MSNDILEQYRAMVLHPEPLPARLVLWIPVSQELHLSPNHVKMALKLDYSPNQLRSMWAIWQKKDITRGRTVGSWITDKFAAKYGDPPRNAPPIPRQLIGVWDHERGRKRAKKGSYKVVSGVSSWPDLAEVNHLTAEQLSKAEKLGVRLGLHFTGLQKMVLHWRQKRRSVCLGAWIDRKYRKEFGDEAVNVPTTPRFRKPNKRWQQGPKKQRAKQLRATHMAMLDRCDSCDC